MIGWKFKTFKKVEITWQDCCTTNGWIPVEEILNTGVPLIKTTGYLIQQTAKLVIIAHTIGLDKDSMVGKGCGYMTIPRGCIIRIRTVKEAI